ncbi:MAG: hypothetical protein JXJ22_14585 [Bacteroidales bacterium]|nr:hypothetical protein [Bacteroidales bacterium]
MNTKNIFKLLLLLVLFFPLNSFAQEDLLDILDEEVEEEVTYAAYTFKSTRIVNGHTIERMKKQQLDFRVNHRFGELNSGAYELWGLDHALINFSFDYGINDWLMVGVRRGTYQKTYDGYLKFTMLRQSTGKRVMPVSVSLFSDMGINTLKITDPNAEDLFAHRLSFVHQVLVARKFNENLSLQLSPTFVHRNQVDFDEENDVIAVGLGGRYKLTRRLSLTAEYFYASHTAGSDKFFNPLSVGFDLETGGHVFQLFLTNSRAMVEKGVIAETTSSWLDGGIYFGFNISRVFAIGKSKSE